MGIEIERKFLVTGQGYKTGAKKIYIEQGFLSDNVNCLVRIRTIGEHAFLTIKGPLNGAGRSEFEYSIPKTDAEVMFHELCISPLIVKHRYVLKIQGITWEIDVFSGDNQGLVIAEVELPNEHYKINLPDWIGKEVTHDMKYYNMNLVRNPFKTWNI